MYNGYISSFSENNFKYNIKLEELPFDVLEKIKGEVYVFSQNGKRKINIFIESDQEILYIKTSQANLIIDYKGIKSKIIIKNVTIKKLESELLYELEFKSSIFCE